MGFSLWCNTAEVLGMKTTEITAILKKKPNCYLLNVPLNFQEVSNQRKEDKQGDIPVSSSEAPNLHSFQYKQRMTI